MTTFTVVCFGVQGVCWLIRGWFNMRTRYYEREKDRLKAEGEWWDACLVAQYEKNTVLEAELLCQLAAEYRRRL